MAEPDWTDPCTRAEILRKAYYELVSGQAQVSYQYQAEGVLRSMTWAKADVSRLADELARADEECAGVTGEPAKRRRFAIEGGSRRGW